MLTDAEKQTMRELRAAGKTLGEIAEVTYSNTTTVWLVTKGVVSKPRYWSKEEERLLLEYKLKKMYYKDIAEIMNRSKISVKSKYSSMIRNWNAI